MEEVQAKRKRGRPRKVPIVAITTYMKGDLISIPAPINHSLSQPVISTRAQVTRKMKLQFEEQKLRVLEMASALDSQTAAIMRPKKIR